MVFYKFCILTRQCGNNDQNQPRISQIQISQLNTEHCTGVSAGSNVYWTTELESWSYQTTVQRALAMKRPVKVYFGSSFFLNQSYLLFEDNLLLVLKEIGLRLVKSYIDICQRKYWKTQFALVSILSSYRFFKNTHLWWISKNL